MTLRTRVLLWLLILMPSIWILAGAGSYFIAKHEIDELFNTQQLRLAQQALANAMTLSAGARAIQTPQSVGMANEIDPDNLALAAWTGAGQLLSASSTMVALPFKHTNNGFQDIQLNDQAWHIYYLSSTSGDRVVAVGQNAKERDEVLRKVLMTSLAPLVAALPLLLVGIAYGVTRTFRPLQTLTRELSSRPATDLSPVKLENAPADLLPLITSMNVLFDRFKTVIAHERRLTADASHELRSPIAALRAQWDALTLATDADAKIRAMAKIDAGIDRLSRLVGQLLNLSTLERDNTHRSFGQVQWHQVIENAISDVLPLIDQRNGDISVNWPPESIAPFPIRGNYALLSMMICNLVDNSFRYGQPGTKVTINIQGDCLQVIDDGPGMAPEIIERAGQQFVRPPGQTQTGSGIGLSIIKRVVSMHGLNAEFQSASTGTTVIIRQKEPSNESRLPETDKNE